MLPVLSISAQAAQYVPVLTESLAISTTEPGGETININLEMERFRSVPSFTNGEPTPNSKIVRFVSDEARSGAGFHSADHVNFSGYVYPNPITRIGQVLREETLSGIAKDYSIMIKPKEGSATPTLFQHFPYNENKEKQYDKRYETSFGVSATAGLEVGADGPKGTASIGITSTQTRLDRIVFSTKEYETKNTTSNNDFKVSFVNTLFTGCGDKLYTAFPSGKDGKCSFKRALTDKQYPTLLDPSRLSPVSYANFSPQFIAGYEVTPDERGNTVFNIKASMTTGKMGAWEVNEFLAFRTESSGVSNDKTISAELNIDVDWSHPIFEPEPMFRLQIDRSENACYEAKTDGEVKVSNPRLNENVHLEHSDGCTNSAYQAWAINKEGQIKNRGIGPDKCLTVTDQVTNEFEYPDQVAVKMQSCQVSNKRQQWEWDGDSLKSKLNRSSGSLYLTYAANNDNWFEATRVIMHAAPLPEGASPLSLSNNVMDPTQVQF